PSSCAPTTSVRPTGSSPCSRNTTASSGRWRAPSGARAPAWARAWSRSRWSGCRSPRDAGATAWGPSGRPPASIRSPGRSCRITRATPPAAWSSRPRNGSRARRGRRPRGCSAWPSGPCGPWRNDAVNRVWSPTPSSCAPWPPPAGSPSWTAACSAGSRVRSGRSTCPPVEPCACTAARRGARCSRPGWSSTCRLFAPGSGTPSPSPRRPSPARPPGSPRRTCSGTSNATCAASPSSTAARPAQPTDQRSPVPGLPRFRKRTDPRRGAAAPTVRPPTPHPSGATPPEIPAEFVPRHVALVMDGNGRWAQERGLARTEGHKQGEAVLMDVVQGCIEMGVPYLSAYAFSTENWKRSPDEVRFLMGFNRDVLRRRRDEMHELGVRVRWAGRRPRLWGSVISEIEEAEELPRDNTVMTLAMCVNYGGRAEIVDAAREFARRVAAGEASADELTEERFIEFLDEPDMPDVDLFLRPSGELRTSNFLLWQSAYAEFVFQDTLFPDFDRRDL